MFELITDAARVASVFLLVTLLVLMQRVGHKQKMTVNTLGLFRFSTMILILLTLGAMEKLAVDAGPSFAAIAAPCIYAYGIKYVADWGSRDE